MSPIENDPHLPGYGLPTKAGIQKDETGEKNKQLFENVRNIVKNKDGFETSTGGDFWIPACAGMTITKKGNEGQEKRCPILYSGLLKGK
ncbi:MAG: hypothetical protein HQL52_03065 [Magnetococcales bacterium]|nr:hypothetical protein [Magnetococcales bacterium]